MEEAHLPIPIQARLNADIEPRVLTMVKEKNKPSDEEKRLADLATKIIDEALRQTDKSTGDRTFMKLQNIVDQVVSIISFFAMDVCKWNANVYS